MQKWDLGKQLAHRADFVAEKSHKAILLTKPVVVFC
jgi:hypothetical protein